jgi:hypothetical protein
MVEYPPHICKLISITTMSKRESDSDSDLNDVEQIDKEYVFGT